MKIKVSIFFLGVFVGCFSLIGLRLFYYTPYSIIETHSDFFESLTLAEKFYDDTDKKFEGDLLCFVAWKAKSLDVYFDRYGDESKSLDLKSYRSSYQSAYSNFIASRGFSSREKFEENCSLTGVYVGSRDNIN